MNVIPGSTRAWLARWIIVGLVLATPAGAQDRPEEWKNYLPPGAGKSVVEQRCAVCHTLGTVVKLRRSSADWQAVVLKMIDLGAPLASDEESQVAGYLGTVFGPEAPPLTDVNVADRTALTKLPGITPALADKIVSHRTSGRLFASRDEVQAVTGLDKQAFEQIKWYIQPAADAKHP